MSNCIGQYIENNVKIQWQYWTHVLFPTLIKMLLGVSSGLKQNHCRKISILILLRVFKLLFKTSGIDTKNYLIFLSILLIHSGILFLTNFFNI